MIEDDWTGTQHKMAVCLSVHEFYTPQLLGSESSFFCHVTQSECKKNCSSMEECVSREVLPCVENGATEERKLGERIEWA